MQTVLENQNASEPEGCGHTSRFAAWGVRSVTMPAWRKLWAPVHTLDLLHPRYKDQTNLWRGAASGGLVGARFATGCEMFRHGGAAMQYSGGMIAVQRLFEGMAAMEYPDRNYVHAPGVIAITDLNQPFRGISSRAVMEQVMVPRAVFSRVESVSFSPILISEESVYGSQLVDELEAFFRACQAGTAYDPRRMGGLIETVIHDETLSASQREEWWHGRRQLIRKYIDTHLDDHNLGPLQICELFNMSRATLYRMFEEDGGVRRRIQDRRLHSAMWDLAIDGVRRGRLSQVAERWGFSSDANFNRAVKQAFGKPPGSLFQKSMHAQLLSIEEAAEGGAFRSWTDASA